jgi:hypothetical protein
MFIKTFSIFYLNRFNNIKECSIFQIEKKYLEAF